MKRYSNYLIAFLLLVIAILVLKFPTCFFLSSDPSASASLAGALIAAGAIFVGNQLNVNATLESKSKELEEERQSIRLLLMSEIVPIFTRHVQVAKEYIDLAQFISTGGQAVVPWSTSYQIIKPNIYYSIIKELIKLPTKEADALVTLYSQMGDTQKALDDLLSVSLTGEINYSTALKLANLLQADCAAAAEVVQLLAPQRKIKLRNDKLIGFVELLQDPTKFR